MLGGRMKIGSECHAGLRGIVHLGMAVAFSLLLAGCSRTHTLRLDGDGMCRSGTVAVRVEHMALCNSDSPQVSVTLRNLGSEPIGLNYLKLKEWLFTMKTEADAYLFSSEGVFYDPDPGIVDRLQSTDEVISPGCRRELTISLWYVWLPDHRFRRGARLKLDQPLEVRAGASGHWTRLACQLAGQLE